MRARTAFVRWATSRVGGRSKAEEHWRRAAEGDDGARQLVAAWLVADGFSIDSGAAAEEQPPGAEGRLELYRALRRLTEIVGVVHPIKPAQIAVALYSDFSRIPDGEEGGPGIRWSVRRCGWTHEATVDLRGDDLEAFKTIVRWGRDAAPGPADSLLAPRADGSPWDARAVRHAVARAVARDGKRGNNVVPIKKPEPPPSGPEPSATSA